MAARGVHSIQYSSQNVYINVIKTILYSQLISHENKFSTMLYLFYASLFEFMATIIDGKHRGIMVFYMKNYV